MSDVGAGTTFEILFPRVAVSTLFDEGLDPSMIDEVEPRVTPPMAMPAISSDGMAPSGGTLVVAGVAPETVRTPDGGVEVTDDLPDRGGASILVVDDELAVAQVVAQALAQAGHAVQIFTNPEEALAAVRHASTAVDLLITDQTMPGLTGDQLAEAVHLLRPNVPVLMLTGFRYRLPVERVEAAGIWRVLDKPVELAVLQQAVEEALGDVAMR
jgi:CheY-like chemotaxis protein